MSEPTGTAGAADTHVVAVAPAARTLGDVEHAVHAIDLALVGLLDEQTHPASYVASTHATSAGGTVVVLAWAGAPTPEQVGALLPLPLGDPHDPAVRTAVADHLDRRSGRLVRYPGRAATETRTTPGAVLAASCVDAVEGLAGSVVAPDSALDLSGFARPVWRDGRCLLIVQQGRGALIPFEVRDQVPCCADH
jgi:hypothetical protein